MINAFQFIHYLTDEIDLIIMMQMEINNRFTSQGRNNQSNLD